MNSLQKDQLDFLLPLGAKQPRFRIDEVAYREHIVEMIAAANLYRKLCAEEGNELNEATTNLLLALSSPEGTPVATMVKLLADVADQAFDKVFVIMGLMNVLGIDFQPIWDRGHMNNMSKFHLVDGKLVAKFRPDGKLLKSSDWVEPNFEAEIRKQLFAPL